MNLLLWSLVFMASAACICALPINIEKTVQHVQDILKQNAQLPRLTREEIIQLLNDIKSEDSKNPTKSEEMRTVSASQNVEADNSSQTIDGPDVLNNEVINDSPPSSVPKQYSNVETTTIKNKSTLMVVLPYTPRDGSSLQELYTKPPRVTVVPEIATKKTSSPKQTFRDASVPRKSSLNIPIMSKDLQKFFDSYGLSGKVDQDHFLLPIEGFKPLHPVKVVDGSVELPEKILLAYDIITPTNNNILTETKDISTVSQNSEFELLGSASESDKTILHADETNKRQTKQSSLTNNYEPLDYDSVKVIPLTKQPLPLDEPDKLSFDLDLSKRQTVNREESTTASGGALSTTVTPDFNTKSASTSDVAASSDSGASITDLEESFGGAAQVGPGESELPPPKKNGFYWMVDWNSFLEVGDGDTKVNIRFEPKLGDPQMFLPVNVP